MTIDLKQQLVNLGLNEEQAGKFIEDGGTIAGLRKMSVEDIVNEIPGMNKNKARTVLGNLEDLGKAQAVKPADQAPNGTERLLGAIAAALPQNLEAMNLQQLWELYMQDQSRVEVRARVEALSTKIINGRKVELPVFVKVGGATDAALSQKFLASLSGKKFVPGKGYRFRGYPVQTLEEALRVRELAQPLTLEPLHDQGDGRLVDGKGNNWGPIMPGIGNGRAAWLTLAQLPQVVEEWGSDLIPDMGPKALIKELKAEKITEDDDTWRLKLAYEDALENNPLLVREAEAMLEVGGGIDIDAEIAVLRRRLAMLEERRQGFRGAPRS